MTNLKPLEGIREEDIRDAVAYARAMLRGDKEGGVAVITNADAMRSWGASTGLLIATILHFFTDEQADQFLEYWLINPPTWMAAPTGDQE